MTVSKVSLIKKKNINMQMRNIFLLHNYDISDMSIFFFF